MLIIVSLGSQRRKAWSTELCTETGLACMIGMLCCHVFLLQHAMLAPAQLLFDCLHIGMWRRLKIQSQRSRGVCSSKKGGSMHVNTILEINKHINGITKFQIPFSRRNLKLAFLRIAISKTDFPKMIFRKRIFTIWSSKFPISISKRGCASQHPTSASHSIKYVTQK